MDTDSFETLANYFVFGGAARSFRVGHDSVVIGGLGDALEVEVVDCGDYLMSVNIRKQ